MDEPVRKQSSSLFTFRAHISGLYPKYEVMDLKNNGIIKRERTM